MSVISNVTKKFGRTSAKLKTKLGRRSPEILLGVGLLGFGVSMALTVKATLNLEPILDRQNEDLGKIKKAQEMKLPDYTEDDLRKDLAIVYTRTVVDCAKLYAPAVLAAGVSVACFVQGHKILNKRNAALVTAYSALDKAYNKYRARVIEEHGEETDRRYRLNLREETREVETKSGKTKEEKVMVAGDEPSVYARWFDETNPHYQNDAEYNMFFLRTRQELFNQRLQAQGHLFLNEVYKDLGLPLSPNGQLVGWLADGNGDGYVDLGMFENIQSRRDFVNGYQKSVLLDFNVDGLIYDQI